MLNGADNFNPMHDDLQLTDAIADILCGGAEVSAPKREGGEGNIFGGAAAAATKLEEKHRNVSALNVKYITASTAFFRI